MNAAHLALASIDSEAAFDAALRRFRYLAMARIVWRELTHQAEVEETLSALSDLADVCIDSALSWHHARLVQRFGEPVGGISQRPLRLIVIGMGKLGGQELNFSSDVDLVFAYPDAGQTQGPKVVDNERFFTRLSQAVIRSLDAATADGFVFRVDMRLRPNGASGLLVSSVGSFARYLHEPAWICEHQALVRARSVAGPEHVQKRLPKSGVACLPREPADVQEQVRHMREKMWDKQQTEAAPSFDLKKDCGGIADIEFMVQYMVLVNAAQHPELTQWTDNLSLMEALVEARAVGADELDFLMRVYLEYRQEVHALALQDQPPVVVDARFDAYRHQVRESWRRWLVESPKH